MKSNDMHIYFINVDVKFTAPLPCLQSKGRTTLSRGFIREFGVTEASEEQAKRLVEERVRSDFKFSADKIREIDFDWIGHIPEDQLESVIFADKEIVESDSFGNPRERGIWYCTGHGYYENMPAKCCEMKSCFQTACEGSRIMNVCKEIALWIRGTWLIFIVRRVTIARLASIMKLQGCSRVFPKCAKRLVFSFLARASMQGRDGAIMNNLAVCYARGLGTAKNERKAFLWYKAASENGCAHAAHSLGGCYYNGWGTKVNDECAFKAFLKSVRLGNYKSACYLGLMHFYGEYVEKSHEKSFLWYRLGALHGDANSQYDLAKCYRNGHGCETSPMMADAWLYIAAQSGSEEARDELERGPLSVAQLHEIEA